MSNHNLLHKALLFAVCLMTHVAVWGQTFTVDNLQYTVLNEQEVEVTGSEDKAQLTGELQIPSTVTDTSCNKTYTVTNIKDAAFVNCSGLTSANIPNSVTTIGGYVFAECSALTSVNIGESVTTIGEGVFLRCSSLTSVNIPNSVTTIGGYVFAECSALASVNIGESVTTIEEAAFLRCSSLTSVNIPNSVTTIGNNAFEGCSSLTSINIGKSVTTIGNYAFSHCHSLTSITITSDNPYYSSSEGVLFDKAQQLLILYPKGKQGEYRIPHSVTTIGNQAFSDCYGLTSIDIPHSVTTIGDHAFSHCYGLTNVNIPNSVTTIGNLAFAVCIGLTNVNIPHSVTTIGERPFVICTRLTSITVASDNPNYSSSDGVLFDKAQQLLIQCPGKKQGVYQIPNSVTTIGTQAFSGCNGLTSVKVPNSVTTIGNYAFGECDSLTNIAVASDNPNYSSLDGVLFDKAQKSLIKCPDGKQGEYQILNSVETIEPNAFNNCNGLTNINIPNSVKTIKFNAIYRCSNLRSLHIYSIEPPCIEYDFFEGCPKFETIYVPQEAVATYQAAVPYYRYNIQGMNEPVGIDKVETTRAPQSGNIYDLNGRLVRTDGNLQALPKGIYIVNGKKVVR